MQPKLLLLPTSSHSLITVTVSSWVHPILSSNLSRKCRTLLQDSFSWHLVITTLHLSWKSCTGFSRSVVWLYVGFHRSGTEHWLPISELIKYKVACMCFHAINGSGPTYLSELLHIYTPARILCSSSDSHMLKIQQYKRKTHGFRTFIYFGPYVWNSLPQDIRQCSTLTSFKTNLKTFLFSQCFHSR